MMNATVTKPLDLGAWKKFNSCKDFAAKTLVLIPSYRIKTSKGTQSVEALSDKTLKKIIADICTNTLTHDNSKLGFAMPTFSEKFLRNMISGFSTVVDSNYVEGQQAHMYICGQQKAESMVENVDKVVGQVYGTSQTRRINFEAVKGKHSYTFLGGKL